MSFYDIAFVFIIIVIVIIIGFFSPFESPRLT